MSILAEGIVDVRTPIQSVHRRRRAADLVAERPEKKQPLGGITAVHQRRSKERLRPSALEVSP